MRIHHFTIIFVIFALSLVIIKDSEFKESAAEKRKKQEYQKNVEKAVEAAAWELRAAGVYFDDKTGERAIDVFYYSLFASLGIEGNIYGREALKEKFPSFTVCLNDGYYIYERVWKDTGAGEKMVYVSSEKLPYDNPEDSRTGFMCSIDNTCYFSVLVSEGVIYIVDTDGIYHEEGCSFLGETAHIVFSKEGCAMLGAHPCRECIDK